MAPATTMTAVAVAQRSLYAAAAAANRIRQLLKAASDLRAANFAAGNIEWAAGQV